jgi:hypothetical protein
MHMKSFAASTTIKAPADVIWKILTDAAHYPEWDPGCIRIEGTIAEGQSITAYTKLSPRAFPVTVTDLVPGQRMSWVGGLPLGLFKGVRTFTLVPKNGSIDFTIREEFSGPLLFLMGRTIPDMNPVFQNFVAGLKARAEAHLP